MRLTGNPFKDTSNVVRTVAGGGLGNVREVVTNPFAAGRDLIRGTSAAASGGSPYVAFRDVSLTPFEQALEEAKAKGKRVWNESREANQQILRDIEETGRSAYSQAAEAAPGDVGYRMRQAETRGRNLRRKLREDWFNNAWELTKTNVRGDPAFGPIHRGKQFVGKKILGLSDEQMYNLGDEAATIGGTIGGKFGAGWVGPAIALVHGIDEDVDANTAASNAIAGLSAGYGSKATSNMAGLGGLIGPMAAGAAVGAAAPGGEMNASGTERWAGAGMGAMSGFRGGYGAVAADAAQAIARENDLEDEMAYLLAATDAYRGNYGGAVGRVANVQAAKEEDPEKRLYWQLGGLAAGMGQQEYNRQAAAPSGEVPTRQPAPREAAGGDTMAPNYDFYGQYGNTAPIYDKPDSPYPAGSLGDLQEWGSGDPSGEIPTHERAGPVEGQSYMATPFGTGMMGSNQGRPAPKEASWAGSFTQPSNWGRAAQYAAPLAKVGLGYLSNMQQQQALAPERKARRKAMDWIQRAQQDPNMIYRNDPGLQQLRANRLNAVKAQYAARYGGTGGGRFMRDLQTQQAAFDRAALSDAINERMQMVNATQYVPAAQAQYGGTGLGALTSAAGEGVNDAYYYNVILPQMLEEQRRQRPTQP